MTQEFNSKLTKSITNEEVWQVVKSIHAFKAPGSDGFQAVFYHSYWTLIGLSVCDFVQDCFVKNHVPSDTNKTLIALIPKIGNHERIQQFRPISRCNVAYKLFSKSL